MLDSVTEMLIETIDKLDVLNDKIDELDQNESKLTWEAYEVANRELTDDILLTLEFLDEQVAFLDEQLEALNQNEGNMSTEAYDLAWDTCDNAYAILLDYQTELVGKQAEYGRKLIQGYSAQLKELDFESSKGSPMRHAVTELKNIIWDGIKKGSAYVWENKEKWYQMMMDKGYEIQDNLLAEKAKAEATVARDSTEKVMNNMQNILNKHRNGEVLSPYEKFYVQAAKAKLGI